MIQRIESQGYRALRSVSVALAPFQVLVGPNGAGKSSLLDVIAFLGDLLRVGLPRAILGDARAGIPLRASDPIQLCFMHRTPRFSLGVELAVPEALRERVGGHGRARYKVTVEIDEAGDGGATLAQEDLSLISPVPEPESGAGPATLRGEAPTPPPRAIIHKNGDGSGDRYRSETSDWEAPFRLRPRTSALANLPEDETLFPVATWTKRLLLEGVGRVLLDVEQLRRPSPPGLGRHLLPNGANLPVAIERLRAERPEHFARWLQHVRTALPDLAALHVIERPEDRHRYLVVEYESGLRAPSWAVSDGTLRLLALTLLGFWPQPGAIYLVEEPENGVHPRAIEAVYQALATVYDAQVLVASHSPIALSLARPEDLLCFRRGPDGAAEVVPGAEHPALRDYQGHVDLGTLFAAGVLE
jgi:energy-coupling factor transporter ATP-binding protein EcfA2